MGSDWIGLDQIALDWIGLYGIGLEIGFGLVWIGLDCFGLVKIWDLIE